MKRLTFALLLFCINVAATPMADIFIKKNKVARWTVTFKMSEPVKRLQFVRTTAETRATRWEALTDGAIIEYQNGNEYVKKEDDGLFDQLSFTLSTGYIHLPKDYMPFMPYTDGGMVVYTGRFFVCANQCDGSQQKWAFHLSVPEQDKILIKGKLHTKQVEWVDQDSGQKVYVGNQRLRDSDQFFSIIDPGLPPSLRTQLEDYLPKLIEFYTAKLGKIDEKPMLFASYSDNNDDSYGNQGGVLSNQISMHWYGKLNEHKNQLGNAVFFFSHEVAHIYQDITIDTSDKNQSWIHEGSADLMAALSMKALLPSESVFVKNKLLQAQSNCVSGLSDTEFAKAGSQKQFRLMYSCGMMIHNTLHKQKDIFQLWQHFQQKVAEGAPAELTSWLAVIKPELSKTQYQRLLDMVLSEHQKTFYRLIEELE